MQNSILENIDILEILIIAKFPIKIIFRGYFVYFISCPEWSGSDYSSQYW